MKDDIKNGLQFITAGVCIAAITLTTINKVNCENNDKCTSVKYEALFWVSWICFVVGIYLLKSDDETNKGFGVILSLAAYGFMIGYNVTYFKDIKNNVFENTNPDKDNVIAGIVLSSISPVLFFITLIASASDE